MVINMRISMLNITETAYNFLLRKSKLYYSQDRLPRLILTVKSCSGARFAVCYDKQREDDQILRHRDLKILVSPSLLQEYEGFELDSEEYFFAPRLLIKPFKNEFKCDCDSKCNKEVNG